MSPAVNPCQLSPDRLSAMPIESRPGITSIRGRRLVDQKVAPITAGQIFPRTLVRIFRLQTQQIAPVMTVAAAGDDRFPIQFEP